MLLFIIAGEVLFWISLLAGVCARYLLHRRTLSTVLLVATPLIDVVIIVLTYIDLHLGAASDFSHGLAAFYVGFSVVFGPEAIARVDRRFAGRHTDLNKVELPAVPTHTSLEYWLRCLTASAITLALLAIGIAIAGLADSFWLIYWTIVAVFTALAWGIVGPLRDRWGKRVNADANAESDAAGSRAKGENQERRFGNLSRVGVADSNFTDGTMPT